jgi:tRNA (cytidine32/uridine32-2'-O)-methyltransferase
MDQHMLDNISIVLVHTSHPGNIGSAARAMKNMGLKQLILVAPKHYPDPVADARAAGALDILECARIVETLQEAIADCHLVMGTSARERSLPMLQQTPRECAEMIHTQSERMNIAILFGEERIGLTNEQLDHCHHQIVIPTSELYPSLNLAAAVQIIAYELHLSSISLYKSPLKNRDDFVTMDEVEKFYQHLEGLLVSHQFLNPEEPKRLMSKLRRLFMRAYPTREEINLLHGVIRALHQQG